MDLEKIPTVPTAEEILDRSLRRAATRMKEKKNKERADREFVMAIAASLHARLVKVMQSFPEFEELPPFYRDLVDALFGIEKLKMALGKVGWAAKNVKRIGGEMSREIRWSGDTRGVRKRAVARLSSVVHRAEKDLLFLNEVRNTLRALPVLRDEFTIVVAGYPNVGKSSFIRLVSSADPQVASYPFTTKGVIVGHRKEGRSGVQFVDTPGILDRPPEDRSPIERQAVSALMHAARAVLFILDPSEMCGYPVERQLALLGEVKEMVPVPVVVAVNKADVKAMEGYLNMSTLTGEGVDVVLAELLRYRVSSPTPLKGRTR
ncbi:MAG: 50S ribosome-binding GTPase [Methanomicrobiales archaeon]|nr:50S ribosome-binding GTPase [Methanomicrobiales archaeon]